MTTENDESLKLQVTELKEAVDKLVRRVDGLQKSVDLVYSDRDILEDLQGSMAALKEILVAHKVHMDSAVKDVKAEVIERADTTQGKVESLTDSVIDTIDLMLRKKQKKLPEQKSFIDKLLRR